jgi:RecG-like helicase
MTTLLAPFSPPRLDTLRPQERVSLAGTIYETETVRAGVSPVYRCVLTGAHGEVDLLFLGRASIAGLTVGTRCTAAGTVTDHHGRLAVWNPRYQVRP